MNSRVVATLLTVIVFVLLAGGSAVAQTGNTWTPPRTPWSDPDLQGIWDFHTLTPMERPSELAGKEFLTDKDSFSPTGIAVRARTKPLVSTATSNMATTSSGWILAPP